MSMRTLKLSVLLVLLVLAVQLLGSCAKEADEVPGELTWITSFDEALQVAEKQKKPVMIDFYADWCGWCKRLDSDTYVNEDVVAKAREFVSLKIDADVERELSGRYRVAGLPTILFIDHTGRELHRVVGYRPPEGFLTEMDAAIMAFQSKTG